MNNDDVVNVLRNQAIDAMDTYAQALAAQPQAAIPEGVQYMLNLAPDVILALRNTDRQRLAGLMMVGAAMLAAAPPSPQPVAERPASEKAGGLSQVAEFAATFGKESRAFNYANQVVRNAPCTANRQPTANAGALQPVAGLTDGEFMDLINASEIDKEGYNYITLTKLCRAAIERHITGNAGASGESKSDVEDASRADEDWFFSPND